MSEGRAFTSWQGEDLSPEYDFTEHDSEVHVIWEEVEVGGRAWKGEADVGTVPLRDERGRTGSGASLPAGLTAVSLAAHNRWRWSERHGSNTMARGWWGPKDYMRDVAGGLRADRYREVRASMLDANEQLKGIIIDANRPEESDVTRVEWVRSTYLAGSPRPTTNIAATYIATGSNTVTLPAQRVVGDPRSVLAEIASFANKEVFVTSDEELFYDGWDSTEYAAGIRISDRPSEANTTASCPTVSMIDTVADVTQEDINTLFLTVGAETDKAIYVAVLRTRSPDTGTDAVTWNPAYISEGDQGASEAFTQIETAGGSNQMQLWRLLNPSPSTQPTSCVRLSIQNLQIGIQGLWFLQGVDQTTPETATNSATGTGSSSSLTITKSASDLVLDAAGWATINQVVTDPTATAGQTVDWTLSVDQPFGQTDMAMGGGRGTATSLTWDFANSHPWYAAAASVRPISSNDDNFPTFPPIWDVGPAATEDGQGLLSGVRMYYGQGSNTYVYVNNATVANQYAHYEEAMQAPSNVTTAAAATTLANAVLARRNTEDRNINVSIGPLNTDQIGCIKYGQRIDIKARAIAFADDAFFTGRIRQLRWTTPVPGMFFAHMSIERPIKDLPYGVGNRASSEAVTSHVLQGSNAHPEFVLRSTLNTQGDLPYRGASDWTRLGIGASNTWLKSIGTLPLWETLPSSTGTIAVEDEGTEEGSAISRLNFTGAGVSVSVVGAEAEIIVPSAGAAAFSGCRLSHSATHSITHNSWNTSLAFDTETFDVDGWHDTVTNNSRITVPTGKDGKINLTVSGYWTNNTTGAERLVGILKNGAAASVANLEAGSHHDPTSVFRNFTLTTGPLDVVATDYFEVAAFQNSGGNLNLNKLRFTVEYLGS